MNITQEEFYAQTKEEIEKCEDPLYFYNKYARHPEAPEVTREQFTAYMDQQMANRNNVWVNDHAEYPLTPEDVTK